MERKFRSRLTSFAALMTSKPHAAAVMEGSPAYPIHGIVRFYQTPQGVVIAAELQGLPTQESNYGRDVFGFHIHSGSHCEGTSQDPFAEAMSHYNPDHSAHPFHAGDLPPLFGNHGYAFSVFLTDRFTLSEVIGKALILHRNPDDFTTQPSGNAGEKIACGVIKICQSSGL